MFFREHQSSNLSFGWSGGGGATIVLEDLGADAPATVTRAEFGMCAGHGVRSPTSSKVQEAGPSHGLGGDVRPLRSLRGCRASPWRSWARGRCRGSGHRTLLNSNGFRLFESTSCLFESTSRLFVSTSCLFESTSSLFFESTKVTKVCLPVVRCEWAMNTAARDDSSQYWR